MEPLPASRALDQFFLDARSRLLDVAATLDRIDRGADAAAMAADPRMQRIRAAIDALRSEKGGRAERIQQIFSLEYDPQWVKPQPRF